MAKMSLTFKGFDDLAHAIDKAGGNLDKAAKVALISTQQHIQQNVTSAASPYASNGRKGYATGAMFRSILKGARIKQSGTILEVDVGFDLKAKGGWHSIFIMYGTPRIAKDAKVYNAIKGAKTKREIAEIQEKVMLKFLDIAKNGGR